MRKAPPGRPPPNPELVRRACERRRAGESAASIARDAGVTESTIRRWMSLFGDPAPVPPILAVQAPAPSDATLAELPAALAELASRLEGADARLVRRAADAIGAVPADVSDMPDPATDTRGWIIGMIARAQKSYDAAERTHNATAAKQWGATLERWSKTLAQHDRARGATDDVVIPAAQIAERERALRDVLERITAQPIWCVECGRRVRVSWAEGATEEKGA